MTRMADQLRSITDISSSLPGPEEIVALQTLEQIKRAYLSVFPSPILIRMVYTTVAQQNVREKQVLNTRAR